MTCPTSAVYTGSRAAPCTAAVTGAGGLDQAVTPVTHSNNTNVGTAGASATYAGDANHTGSSDSKAFGITKATSTVTVSCPTSVLATGSAIAPCTATATGVGDLAAGAPVTVTYANNILAGTATATAVYGGNSNHNGSSSTATFTINPWTLSGFYQPVDMGGVVNTVKGGSTVPLKFEAFSGSRRSRRRPSSAGVHGQHGRLHVGCDRGRDRADDHRRHELPLRLAAASSSRTGRRPRPRSAAATRSR